MRQEGKDHNIMSFDNLFQKDRPNKTLPRTADQHWGFTMTDNLKLNFKTQRALRKKGKI